MLCAFACVIEQCINVGAGIDEQLDSAHVAAACCQVQRAVAIVAHLYGCPQTTVCILTLMSVCPHTAICVVLLLLYMCPHTAGYMSFYCYICVLVLLYVAHLVHVFFHEPFVDAQLARSSSGVSVCTVVPVKQVN
jgi:hypothetical protein